MSANVHLGTNGIWGDAFRHPFAYQELCGFATIGPTSSCEAAGNSDGGNGAAPADSSNVPFNVKVALMQAAPPASKAEASVILEEFMERAAGAGADIVLTPEMWSVGWDHLYPTNADRGPEGLRRAYEWTYSSETVAGDFIMRVRQPSDMHHAGLILPFLIFRAVNA